MQNKKSLLQRLLVIYITFFIVLAASIAHSVLPNFTKGYSEGARMGHEMLRDLESGTPRMIYMLTAVPVERGAEFEIGHGNADCPSRSVRGRATQIALTVGEDAPGISVCGMAFRSIGGRTWMYACMMLSMCSFLAIIVLMFLIIRSLRRSIREERTLDRRNVTMLRTIGALTILSEALHDLVEWSMARRAAELLAGSGYTIDTGLHVSYTTLIMGILILFAAEVFAIGQNLSEEQRLTI